MCDASDFVVGAVLGQRIDGKFKLIYYANKTLNNAQEHYTTTEKELLAIVFSFDKFHPYLVLSKTIVYTDHSALKNFFSKQDAKPRLIRWVLLFQGFDIEIKDKRGAENLAADHLSRLKNPELSTFTEEEIADEFPDEYLMALKTNINNDEPWLVPSCFAIFDLEPLSFSFDFIEHEHVIMNPTSAGMRHLHLHLYMNPEIKQLAIKRVVEYGFIQRISLTGFPAQSVGSSNTDVSDLLCLLVLITGMSQSRQHESHHRFFLVDTSSIHIESRKSPTKSLFDVGSSRISIFTMNTLSITRMFWQDHKDNAKDSC
ncbi:reverse transcriptase domain-containing protein [Tanacetum coccineum]